MATPDEIPAPTSKLRNAFIGDLKEATALDRELSDSLDAESRTRLWSEVAELLQYGPLTSKEEKSTVLALGRIQSGKTTAITATTALARDIGYRLIIAILGSTKLLVEQNTNRLLDAHNIGRGLRSTYGWIHIDSASLRDGSTTRFSDAVSSGRTILVTTLKHPRHLEKLSRVINRGRFSDLPALIVDDEADQASLNLEVLEGGDSPTHRSIGQLYDSLDQVLYAQFTATPYAPLLIQPTDILSPRHLVVLQPGEGYTGAKEFFVDHALTILRKVPNKESHAEAPGYMPEKLREALANFMIGAAWLWALDLENAPISMLIHSSHKTDTHKRLDVLVRRELEVWDSRIANAKTAADLPSTLRAQLADLIKTTGSQPPERLLDSLKGIQRLKHIWVVNSKAEEDKVDWSLSPAHILIGGNKLDRGFTVEGLTVTYLSRRRSAQLDTLYQRARAFGYRSEYLPFCRFYASTATLKSFRSGIETDLAMRESLQRWQADGKDLRLWSSNEPLLLEKGIRPTRPSVVAGIDMRDLAGWHFASRPSLRAEDIAHNKGLVEETGILEANHKHFGRLSHRHMTVPVETAARLVRYWKCDGSCGFNNEAIATFLDSLREADILTEMSLLLLESPDQEPRERDWSPLLGIRALFQGRSRETTGDPTEIYVGDRYLLRGRSQIQVHRLRLKGSQVDDLLTIAVRIGDETPVTTELRRL